MVPVMDTYMKSFPVLSQMSEGEDGGRKGREEMFEENRGSEKQTQTEKNAKQQKLNDAQRP